MTPEQLALLRAAAEKATPGPWHAPGLGEVHMPSHDCVAQICFKHEFADEDELFGTEADAQFIAAANPATILALLDHIDQVRASTIAECAEAAIAIADRCREISKQFKVGGSVAAIYRDRMVGAFDAEEAIRALALPAAPNEEKST